MNINTNTLHKNGIHDFLKLNLYTKFSNKTFNQAIYIMSYTENIEGCTMFLQYLETETDLDIMITARECLVIYMICFFHNDVLSTNKNPTETLLYEKCKELVRIIQDYTLQVEISKDTVVTVDTVDTVDIVSYIKKLNTFSVLFNVWKSKDLDSQKDIYVTMYVDYSEEISTFIQKATHIHQLDYYKTYIENLVEMKIKIKKCLVQLVGKEECEELIETKKNPIGIFNTDSKEVIRNYVREAYWTIFKNNLEDDTIQNKDIIDSLATTIKSYMKNMYGQNTEQLKSIYSQIDFIVDSINHTSTIKQNLIDLLYIVYNELIFFSPTNKILEKVEEKLENLEDIDTIIHLFKIMMNEYDRYMPQ